MGRVIIHQYPNPERLAATRVARHKNLSALDQIKHLYALIHLAMAMNGGKPLRGPQGKGLVIRKPKA